MFGIGWNQLMLGYFNWSCGTTNLKVAKTSDPVRFGVLGAAEFSPVGLFDPARTHADVVVTAIAARNLEKAQAQAKAYSIPRALGSYQDLIELDDIDAVYIPLPITKHAEWAIKAARAGKHVLIEKPMCSNQDEARAIQQCARETGKVMLEAFHWQFHPASHVFKALADSGRYGRLLSAYADLYVAQDWSSDDIRVNYHLGGGACMDLAYVFSAIRYFVGGAGQYEVTSAEPILRQADKLVDMAMTVQMDFKPDDKSPKVTCKVFPDLRVPKLLGFIPKPDLPTVVLEFENAKITYNNFVAPHLSHSIIVEDKITKVKTTQKHYSFGPKWGARSEPYWSTWRYQLEAFVAKVRGEDPPHWIDMKDSVAMAALIDQVYDKAGLPRRGLSVA